MKIKVFSIISIVVALIILAIFFVNKHVITFYYMNPYTETASFEYIAPTIKELNTYLDKAKELSAMDGYKYDIVYTNAYGSGFLKRNPIPNDLDFDVFIDLGTFDYSGDKSKYEIAEEMVKKMDSFQYSLIAAIDMDSNKETFTYRSPSGQYNLTDKRHEKYVAEIANSLDNAITEKRYINHLTKISKNTGETVYYMPYVMDHGKLIVKDYDLVMMFNNQIQYNKTMPKYIRELSIGLGFTAKVKKDGKISTIELIPELFSTGPLALSNRLYAPNVFFYKDAPNYIKNMPELANDETFFKSLMYCFQDHLLVIYPNDGLEFNPLKAMKRTLQIVDMIEPALPQKDVQEVRSAIEEELQNRDIVLLNEFNNIVTNLNKIYIRPVLFIKAAKNGDIDRLLATMNDTLDEMESRNKISKEHIKVFKEFRNNRIKEMLNDKNYKDMKRWQRAFYDRKYRYEVSPTLSKAVLSQMKHKDLINKHIGKLRDVCDNLGYQKINIYVADNKTIELEENEFTKGIKDFKDFARQNDLADDMDYVVLPKSKINARHIKYDYWVRYNTTKEQDKYYNEVKQTLINSKSQFKMKKKHFFVFK